MDTLSDYLSGPINNDDLIQRLRAGIQQEGWMVKNGKLVYSKPVGRGNLDLGAIRGLGFNYDDGLNSFMGSYKPGMLRFQYNRRF